MTTGEQPEEGNGQNLGELIVIVTSSLSIEALATLVGTLPAGFPAPVVLAQHLDHNRVSGLGVMLQHRTSLRVEVVDGERQLLPGRIYIALSNRHILVTDGHVTLQAEQETANNERAAIDTLLASATEAYADRLIAVLLAGSGTVGATGAVIVKNAGGMVLVQDTDGDAGSSMPLALPPTVVDFFLPADQIGPFITQLLQRNERIQTAEQPESILPQILDLVNQQAHIDFRLYKTSTIIRRINRRMTVTRSATMRDYAQYLELHPEEIGELVSAFLINVTQFFRDPDAFEYLRNEIMPNIIARSRDNDRILRFWSAGCATGEEPYSLAMLIADMLSENFAQWSVKIFATDIDEAAITFARRGIYSESELTTVPDQYRERFFERTDQGYRISKTLRQMVIFGQQDLSRSAPFPHIDLVLCRNVLIYFAPELQEYVLSQFGFSLCPGGYLLLGKAETVRPTQPYYELLNKTWKMYRCIASATPVMRRHDPPVRRRVTPRPMPSLPRPSGDHDQEASPLFELVQLRRFNELMLRYIPVGLVVIDRAYHVITANGTARRLLGLRETGSDLDFLHSMRGIPYAQIRAAIDTVFRDRTSFTLPEIELDGNSGSSGHFLSFTITLMQMEAEMPDLAVISVSDITESVETRRQLESSQEEQAQLMSELSKANQRLNEMNKELMDANEELQVANEELVITHEELQSSIEEFETTNEELQATNEELETNNEELQATNEELQTTNDELRARSNELEETTTLLDSERARLAGMVELAPFGIMVLRGPHLIVEALSPAYAHLFEGRVAAVQGRPLEEVVELFWQAGSEVVDLARQVYRRDEIRTSPRLTMILPNEQHSSSEQYYIFTIVPTHTSAGEVDGVVVYASDVTEMHERELADELHRLQVIFTRAEQIALALYDAQTARLLLATPRYSNVVAHLRRLRPESLSGDSWQATSFLTEPGDAAAVWYQVLQNYTTEHRPEVRQTIEGRETVWNVTVTPVMDVEQAQRVNYVLVSAIEITDQVRARQEQERLHQLRDEFLSLASHELRTPVTVIKGNAQVLQRALRRQGETVPLVDRTLGQIEQQATQINQLITELMDVAHLRSNQFELHREPGVDLVALAQRVVEQYQVMTTDHSIHLEAGEPSITGEFDISRLERVLNNLLENAVRYSPAGTEVAVSIRREGDEAVIAVHDQGKGISPEEQKHIFERFYRGNATRHGEGLGLGLYIVNEIVSHHGGRLTLESAPGRGTTFTVRLPLTPGSSPAQSGEEQHE